MKEAVRRGAWSPRSLWRGYLYLEAVKCRWTLCPFPFFSLVFLILMDICCRAPQVELYIFLFVVAFFYLRVALLLWAFSWTLSPGGYYCSVLIVVAHARARGGIFHTALSLFVWVAVAYSFLVVLFRGWIIYAFCGHYVCFSHPPSEHNSLLIVQQ